MLALREIVSDLGADRGILLSEEGFQSGAREAANLTNVQVTSIAEMRVTASDVIDAMRLRDLYDRLGVCKDRYWDIPKDRRIAYGLRAEAGDHNYSGNRTIEFGADLLTRAFRKIYPFQSDSAEAAFLFGRDRVFHSPKEVIDLIQERVSELDEKLNAYDHSQHILK